MFTTKCDTCQELLIRYDSAVSAYLQALDAGDEQREQFRQACRSASESLLAHAQSVAPKKNRRSGVGAIVQTEAPSSTAGVGSRELLTINHPC